LIKYENSLSQSSSSTSSTIASGISLKKSTSVDDVFNSYRMNNDMNMNIIENIKKNTNDISKHLTQKFKKLTESNVEYKEEVRESNENINVSKNTIGFIKGILNKKIY